ncbi:MAG: hypothetical protein R2939_18065, partial [Kofleriaceae bacterium]
MRAALIAALLVLALGGTAAATPSDELALARDAYRQGDCPRAVPMLSVLLYPTPRLASAADLGEAHLLYGACLVASGDAVGAGREFEEALFVRPDLTADPLLFSAETVRIFEQARAAVAVRIRQEAEARALAEERERLRRYKESLIVYEQRPYYMNFLPGGAGQFQRGATGLGVFFATSQVLTAATSAGIW